MDIESRREGRAMVVALSGSIDALGGPEASVYLAKIIDGGDANLVLDLSGVTFISSAGVRMVLNVVNMARQAGGDSRLAALPRNVRKVLDIGGITGAVQTFEDVTSAVVSFAG